MYGYEIPMDSAFVKSWTVHAITVTDCPVIWQSKLWTEIVLLTMEVKIINVKNSCWELFHIMDMVKLTTCWQCYYQYFDSGGKCMCFNFDHYAPKTTWFCKAIMMRSWREESNFLKLIQSSSQMICSPKDFQRQLLSTWGKIWRDGELDKYALERECRECLLVTLLFGEAKVVYLRVTFLCYTLLHVCNC